MSNTGNSYPHWLGLLKWSLSQTDPTGGHSDCTAMTKENREFLDAVMKDLVKDEPGDLQRILKEFQEIIERGISDDDGNHILDLLQDTQDIVDQIDMANVFIKFGGAVVLTNILCSTALSDTCKCTASVVCGELAQNNPTAQSEMLKFGLLDQLAVVCASPSTSSALCNKSLFGISCIIRGSKDGEDRFCDTLSGPSLLSRLLQRQDDMCSKRVMFLANALMMSDFASSSRVSSILTGILPSIFDLLDSSDIDSRDTCYRLLLTAVSSAAGMTTLSPLLRNLQRALEFKLESQAEEHVHEKSIIMEILGTINKNKMEVGQFSTGTTTSRTEHNEHPTSVLKLPQHNSQIS